MDRYSTLEVDHSQDPRDIATHTQPPLPDYSRFPEAVPVQQQNSEASKFDQIQKVYVPNDHLAPEAIPNQHDHNYNGAVPEAEAAWRPSTDGRVAEKRTESKRICGLRRKIFFVVLVVAIILIIGAVAGGVAGALVSRKSSSISSPSGDNATTTPNRVNVMDISSLAATNWTDGKGYDHRTVFFQDPWNSIIARRWDSQNKTWTTTNVTAATLNTATPLKSAWGTSLAAAALDWPNAYRVQLYFLDPSDVIRSTYSDAPVQLPDYWKNDTLGSANIRVMHGSKLAAAWARDEDPKQVGVWTVAYQGADQGFVKVANFSNYNAPVNGIEANRVAGNTSLALVPQYGGSQVDLGLVSQSFTSGTSGSIQISSWNETWKKAREFLFPCTNSHTAERRTC